MDAEEFGRGMNLLSSIFDPDVLSEQKAEDRFKGYWLVLGDQLDDGEFWAACVWASRRPGAVFFPKPAELLAHRTEAERAAREEEDRARHRLRGEYYAALNAEVDARGTPGHPEALERLRLATAAHREDDPDQLVYDPSAPALTRAGGAAGPDSGEAPAAPGPVSVGEALRAGVVDLAERRARRKGAG